MPAEISLGLFAGKTRRRGDGYLALVGKLKRVILPKFGNRVLSTLKKDQLFKLYMELKSKGLAHTTIQKYHEMLSVLGQLYVDFHPGKSNPIPSTKEFRKFFPKQPPTRAINFLTPSELEQIFEKLKSCQSRMVLPYIQLIAFTGLRRAEALELKWQDIDFEAGFIHVRKSKNGTQRKIPLEPGSIEALKTVWNFKHSNSESYIFSNRYGNRYNNNAFLKPFKRAVAQAGINKRVDIHSLRHSWASNKIRAGWGIKKVSMILGHADISLTSDVYAHLLDGDLKVRDDFRFDFDKVDILLWLKPEDSLVTAAYAAERISA